MVAGRRRGCLEEAARTICAVTLQGLGDPRAGSTRTLVLTPWFPPAQEQALAGLFVAKNLTGCSAAANKLTSMFQDVKGDNCWTTRRSSQGGGQGVLSTLN